MPLLKDRVTNLEFMIEKLNQQLTKIKAEQVDEQVKEPINKNNMMRRRAI